MWNTCVEILQGWCTARTMHCDGGYDVNIATLPVLYLPKMKNALFVAPESTDFLVLVLGHVHICTHPLNELQERNNTSWWRGTLTMPFDGKCLEPIMLIWKFHKGNAMEFCDGYNNCTKFQFYTLKIFRDIPFLVI